MTEPYKQTLCRVITNKVRNNARVFILADKDSINTAPTIPLKAFPEEIADYLFENADTFMWVMARYIDRPPKDGGPQIDEDSWVPIGLKIENPHLSNCCKEHGCKWNQANCPVKTGKKEQFFPCSDCDEHQFYVRQRERGERGEDNDPQPLRERLAALEHDQWAHWTEYLLDTIRKELDEWEYGGERFDQLVCIERWARQISSRYADLSEKEKDSDREWADKVLACIAENEPMILPDGWLQRATALMAEIGVEMPWITRVVASTNSPTTIVVGSGAVATSSSKWSSRSGTPRRARTELPSIE